MHTHTHKLEEGVTKGEVENVKQTPCQALSWEHEASLDLMMLRS